MNFWFFFIGLAIILLGAIDLVVTTFAPTGSGMVTGKLRRWVWKLFLKISGGDGSKHLLNYAGPVTVVTWLTGWLLLIWLGSALLLISDDSSVVAASTLRSTTWQEKFYFTGYTLSTLGSGEFIPYGTAWQLCSVVISLSGFMFITIAITYLYSVVTNDINRRKTSLKIYHTGSTPAEILLRFWDGKGFQRLHNDLPSLSAEILQVAQNHMAYPVLHNFHSTKREEAFVLNVAALDEALTLLLLYKPDHVSPSLAELYPLRSAITYYLQTLRNAFISPSKEDPPAPNRQPLLANKLALQGPPFEEMVGEDLRLRRKLLKGLLHSQGWNWSALENNHSLDPLDDWLTKMRDIRTYPWPRPSRNEEEEKKEEVTKPD